MKQNLKWAALPLILIFTIAAVEPGLKIWQYPNRPVPSDTAFFVLSEGGVTYNVSAFQLRSKMTQGLATVTYVNSVTSAPSGGGDQVWTNALGVIRPVSTNAIRIKPDGSIENSGVSNYFEGDINVGSSLILSTNWGDPNTANMTLVGQFGSQEIWIYDGINYAMDLWPSSPPTGNAYSFGTIAPHTDGYLLDIFNGYLTDANRRFAVKWDGSAESTNAASSNYFAGDFRIDGRFQITNGASAGRVLTSDANGVGTWATGGSSTATNAISSVWSNNVPVASLATNLDFWFSSTAGVALTNRNGHVDATFTTLAASIVTNLLNTLSNTLWTNLSTLSSNYTTIVSNALVTYVNSVSNNLYTNIIAQVSSTSSTNFALIVSTNYLEHRAVLAYSGVTNVIVDIQSANAFLLTLTNNALLIFTNWPPDPLTKTINIDIVQDATGGRKVFFDSHIKFTYGGVPIVTTNANAWDTLTSRVGPTQTNFATAVAPFFQ